MVMETLLEIEHRTTTKITTTTKSPVDSEKEAVSSHPVVENFLLLEPLSRPSPLVRKGRIDATKFPSFF